MKDLIKNIDFELLKKQKLTLLETIEKAETEKEKSDLHGIICLIDSIQDLAVDKFGIDEKIVFNLENS